MSALMPDQRVTELVGDTLVWHQALDATAIPVREVVTLFSAHTVYMRKRAWRPWRLPHCYAQMARNRAPWRERGIGAERPVMRRNACHSTIAVPHWLGSSRLSCGTSSTTLAAKLLFIQ